jgi:UDP-N-acetylglucosamine--dolichyl-phosphate N-acetylglucosaminephosphotransferase
MEQIFFLLAVFLAAILSSYYLTSKVVAKLKLAQIFGKDMHKKDKPQVVEMGGIAIVGAFVGSSIFGIILHLFFGFSFEISGIMATLLTVCIVAIIGIYDDLVEMGQLTKALLPLSASVPLVAIEMTKGYNMIAIPFLGTIDFGILYPLLLVPLAIAVCSNLTNMLAGFNGLEVGMGIVIFATLFVLSLMHSNIEMSILSIAMLGALFGFLKFNWYPAKTFLGDVGTLTIGCAIGATVIVSSLKSAGVVLMTPFILDWIIKLVNKFPKSFAHVGDDGKLYAPKDKVRGFADLILRISGGISEQRLVLSCIAIEIVIAIFVLLYFGRY